jgi:hypothetical protein
MGAWRFAEEEVRCLEALRVVGSAGRAAVAGGGAAGGGMADGGGPDDSEIPTIGKLTAGSLIWSSGVPAGTSTVSVSCAPPRSVTVTVRFSAEAGTAASAIATDAPPHASATTAAP